MIEHLTGKRKGGKGGDSDGSRRAEDLKRREEKRKERKKTIEERG